MTSKEFRKFEKLKLNNDRYDKYVDYTNRIASYELSKQRVISEFGSKYDLRYYEEGATLTEFVENKEILRICLKDESKLTDEDWCRLCDLLGQTLSERIFVNNFLGRGNHRLAANYTVVNLTRAVKQLMSDILETEARLESYNERIKELRQMIKEL